MCFVCFVDHKAPGAVVPGLQIRSGSMGLWVGDRWRRCAPLSARGWYPVGMRGGRMGRGTTKDTKDTKAPGLGFRVFRVFRGSQSPRRGCAGGVQIQAGSMGFWVGNRWCRFAQPPATGWHPFGMTGDGNAAGDVRAPGVGGGRARGATHHGELGLVDGVIAPVSSRWGGSSRGGNQRGRGIVAGFIRSQPGLDAAMP